MFERELKVFRFNQQYAHMLLDGVEPAQWNTQPFAGANTPTWIFGHLAHVGNSILVRLQCEGFLEQDWSPFFGMNSTVPSPDDENFVQVPSPAAILDAYNTSHERVSESIPKVAPATFSMPSPHERLRPLLPTVGDLIGFILTSHEAIHLGQMSAWRRAMGMPPAIS